MCWLNKPACCHFHPARTITLYLCIPAVVLYIFPSTHRPRNLWAYFLIGLPSCCMSLPAFSWYKYQNSIRTRYEVTDCTWPGMWRRLMWMRTDVSGDLLAPPSWWHTSPPNCAVSRAMASFLGFIDHTRRAILVRTLLDEWSARRRDLNLTTHNSHNKHPCPRRDSNSQPQQANGRRTTP